MNINLFNTLYNKNILSQSTVITGYYPARMLGGITTTKLVGTFNFVKYVGNKVTIKRVNTNEFYIISVDDIMEIDGMDPSRLASIYGIKADGTKKKEKIDPITGLPVRRGRKTNKVKELINERLNRLGTRIQANTTSRKTKTRKPSSKRETWIFYR